MATLRFIIGGGSVFLFCRFKRIPLRLNSREFPLLVINALLFASQIGFFYLGIYRTTASHSVVLINSNVFFVAFFAHFFLLDDRLAARKTLGLLLAFSGVLFVFWAPMPSGPLRRASLVGNGLILLSAVILAAKTVYIKRLIEFIEPTKVVFWEMAMGVPLLGLASGLFDGERAETTLAALASTQVFGAILYQGVIVGGFCFVASTILLARHPASAVVSFSATVPLFGILLSHLILGEALPASLLLGAGLVAIGIALVNYRNAPATVPE